MLLSRNLGKALIFVLIAIALLQSTVEFQRIAGGTGTWWGEYSLKWGMAYGFYILLSIFLAGMIGFALFRWEQLQPTFQKITSFRARLGLIRWVLVIVILIAPVWFFQYTPWGVVYSNPFFRLLAWGLIVLGLTFMLGKGERPFGWVELLVAVILTSTTFTFAAAFTNVTNYPFSLGWSEGNRMWDYSIMFGRQVYDYPADQEIWVHLDMGRQFVGGLPFLLPGLTIGMERFWIGLTQLIPYSLLGLAVFRSTRNHWQVWLLTTLWVLLFLKQGPIHPPLVLCATVVALLWRSPLWLAIPLIAVTGYVAEESRFTWIFASGMWIATLELAGAPLEAGRLSRTAWIKAISLGTAGILGGYFGQKIAGLLAGNASVGVAVTTQDVASSLSSEPLLWYRLFPNATYGFGILLALLVAVLPLILVLIYLVVTKRWTMNVWQSLIVISTLLAFLVVGLVVSTKIGGGGDLHNMDMFLIGLMFTGVLAWQKGGAEWIRQIDASPVWVKLLLVFMLAWPGYYPLMEMRSFSFGEEASWLVILTDAPTEKSLGMLPSRKVTERSLEIIRSRVALAQTQGEVLFMDQRQLLTFGYIKGVAFVPEYEKKVLMSQALNTDEVYFKEFYEALASHRFSLIVSEPLHTPIKDVSYQFGEENNAWVKWVSAPILCYYEPAETLIEVKVQLLVPRLEPADCSSILPEDL
jgi:hypothetical protein